MTPTESRDRATQLAPIDFHTALVAAREVSNPWYACQALASVARYALEAEAIPDQLMHGVGGERNPMDACQVLPTLPLTAKAPIVGKPRLEVGEDPGRQRGPFAWGFCDGQQGAHPSRFIEPQPSLTQVKSPQPNGLVERFHRTMLNDFSRIPFRKKISPTLSERQTDLEACLHEDNETRVPQGRWCFGWTPRQPF